MNRVSNNSSHEMPDLPPPQPIPPNPWSVIHGRYADAVMSNQWNESTERQWLDNEFINLVPCGSCGSKWLSLSATIDLSSAENAFRTLWSAHNVVSTEHVLPPLPAMSYEQCRRLWFGPKVAFLAAAYQRSGGTETFHRTLLTQLRHHCNIIGFVATSFYEGDGSLLKVPYSTGLDSAKGIAKQADVLVTWGIDCLRDILPENRPKVISVHHSDWSHEWSNGLIASQLESIDEIVCVNNDVATRLRGLTEKPVHYIPNAVDPERLITTGKAVNTEQKKIVLFGHRMVDEKRPSLAIEMAYHLPDDWLLIMLGDGPCRPNEIPPNVRFLGRVETMADWLAVADCFISMSTADGFGLSIAEAHAMGVPVVSTPVGIAPQIAATMLPIDANAEQWAQAVVESVGKQNKPADFSVETHVKQWCDVITSAGQEK